VNDPSTVNKSQLSDAGFTVSTDFIHEHKFSLSVLQL
jgi:hypothetical protein